MYTIVWWAFDIPGFLCLCAHFNLMQYQQEHLERPRPKIPIKILDQELVAGHSEN